jgi:hypothetical protein
MPFLNRLFRNRAPPGRGKMRFPQIDLCKESRMELRKNARLMPKGRRD